MHMFKPVAALLIVASLLSPAFAQDAQPFATDADVALVNLLPPPPANDSAQTKSELVEVLMWQVTRTPEQAAAATADDEETIWRFANVVNNPKFTKENLPKFAAFFDRIAATEGAVVDPAKKVWARPRPHMYSDLVKPIVHLSTSGAYPSGHTTLGTLEGIELGAMLPEMRTEIMTRAWDYGHNRLVAGIHFASDIEAGRIAGTAIAQNIQSRDDFKAEYEAARLELRSALGLK